MILPWFGGSAVVWKMCLLFFQCALLLGYAYAHWLTRRFSPRSQALSSSILLAVSLLALPIVPNPLWKPPDPDHLAARVLALVARWDCPISCSRPPVRLQAWHARARMHGAPYRLFALSKPRIHA